MPAPYLSAGRIIIPDESNHNDEAFIQSSEDYTWGEALKSAMIAGAQSHRYNGPWYANFTGICKPESRIYTSPTRWGVCYPGYNAHEGYTVNLAAWVPNRTRQYKNADYLAESAGRSEGMTFQAALTLALQTHWAIQQHHGCGTKFLWTHYPASIEFEECGMFVSTATWRTFFDYGHTEGWDRSESWHAWFENQPFRADDSWMDNHYWTHESISLPAFWVPGDNEGYYMHGGVLQRKPEGYYACYDRIMGKCWEPQEAAWTTLMTWWYFLFNRKVMVEHRKNQLVRPIAIVWEHV